jgi:hypothetical protein
MGSPEPDEKWERLLGPLALVMFALLVLGIGFRGVIANRIESHPVARRCAVHPADESDTDGWSPVAGNGCALDGK